jgi:hypothetical protein
MFSLLLQLLLLIVVFSVLLQLLANALIKKGSLMMQKERQDEAIQVFRLAEEADPKNSDVYHHRGQVQYHAFLLSLSLKKKNNNNNTKT